MHRANAYSALATALEEWRRLPALELVARIGLPPSTQTVQVDGEELALDISARWSNAKQEAIRVQGVACGPSHWRLERVEEAILVQAA